MRKLHVLFSIAGLVAVPALHAQERTRAPMPPQGENCVTTGGKVECRVIRMSGGRDSVMKKRAALGIQLQPTGSSRDTLGVFIGRVTPGGPAESAGIVEGERVAAINGIDLKVASGDIDDHYMAGLPAHRLTREVAKLTPGSRVNLRVYSGGRYRDVQVTAGSQFDMMKKGGDHMGFMFGPGMGMMHGGPDASGMMLRSTSPRVRIFRRDGPEGTRAPKSIRVTPRGGEELEVEIDKVESRQAVPKR